MIYISVVLIQFLMIDNTRLSVINPIKTKRRLLYLKTQSVPRCKHFSSGL